MNRHYFNLKGQALLELATLGTILIFCLGILISYGLEATFRQEAYMNTFRRAMSLAYNQTSEQMGPSGAVNVYAIDDRRMISPDNAYGLASHSGVPSYYAGITWSNKLNKNILDSSPAKVPIDAYRPRTFYMMNGQTIATVTDETNTTVNKELSYTVSGFVRYPCSNTITVREVNPSLPGPVYWTDVVIDCVNQTVVRDPGSPSGDLIGGYYDSLGKVQFFNSADVDGDGKEEIIVKVEGSVDGPIEYLTTLEEESGEIMDDQALGLGLQDSYKQVENKSGAMLKIETADAILTATRADERGSYTGRGIKWQERVTDPNTGAEISKTIHTDGFGTGRGYDKTIWQGVLK